VADEFEGLLVEGTAALRVGDPWERDTQVGPLARPDLRDVLQDQVERSVAAGARLATGGQRLEGRGYFYAPTVLTNVAPEMPVSCEETFGPVAAVMRAKDGREAVAIANDSLFGLGASLWTRDTSHGKQLAHELETGSVFINGMVLSDPRLPFGGVKRSGYGRELSDFGIREFVNVQTVWVGHE
jgi:succinate-semialdehyde dehydrogenase/glutarate-semialdehyde dehydrogenase